MENGRQAVVPLTAVNRVETVLTAGTDTGDEVLEALAPAAGAVAGEEEELDELVTDAVAVAAGAVPDELTPGELEASTSVVLMMVPVAVPAVAAAVAGSESDPLAPQADRTTQHATMEALRPRNSSIERPDPKEVIGMSASDQRPTAATMSWKCDYVFVSIRLSRSNITSIAAISGAPIGDRIIET